MARGNAKNGKGERKVNVYQDIHKKPDGFTKKYDAIA